MKIAIIVMAFLAAFGVAIPTSAQVKMDLDWAKDIGSDSTRETVFSTAIDTRGNVIVLTRTWDLSPEPTRDIFKVQKYTTDGQFLWEKKVKGSYEQGMLPGGLCVDSNDNIFFLLNTINKSFYFDTILIKCPNWESSIFKLSSTGELLWMKQIDQLFGGWAMEDNTALLAIDRNNDLVFSGYARSSDSIFKIDGIPYFKTPVYGGFFVAKFSNEGPVLWVKLIDENHEEGHSSGGDYLAIDDSNNIIVLGKFWTSFRSFETEIKSEGPLDMFLAKILPTGKLVWVNRIGGNLAKRADWPWGLAMDNENFIYAQAVVYGDVTVSGWSGVSTGPPDPEILICKFDSFGKVVWDKRVGGLNYSRIGGTIDDCPMGIVYSPKDDAIIVRSHLFGDAKIDTATISIDEEAGKPVVWSYSKDGDVNWIHQIDNIQGYVQFNNIDVDNDGYIYMGGYAGIYWTYVTSPLLITIADTSFSTYGSNDGILAKFSLKEFSRVTPINNVTHLSTYPNPFSERTTISLPDNVLQSSSSIQVFNVLGVKVLETPITTTANNFVLERQGITAGIYHYQIVNGKSVIAQGEFAVQ